MKTYLVSVTCEVEVEAESEAEAIRNAESDLWSADIIQSRVTYVDDSEEDE